VVAVGRSVDDLTFGYVGQMAKVSKLNTFRYLKEEERKVRFKTLALILSAKTSHINCYLTGSK
jgi:hypothetical protein